MPWAVTGITGTLVPFPADRASQQCGEARSFAHVLLGTTMCSQANNSVSVVGKNTYLQSRVSTCQLAVTIQRTICPTKSWRLLTFSGAYVSDLFLLFII